MESKNRAIKNSGVVVTAEFDAKKDVVFSAFAEAEALAEWWGPPGVPITVVKFDFRPKGIFHYKSQMQGQTVWGRFVYGEIARPDVLEFTSSFSDEKGGITRAPFSEKFPIEIFNRLEFLEDGAGTKIKLTGYPVNATEEEELFFASMTQGIQQGFAGTFSQLRTFLSKQLRRDL